MSAHLFPFVVPCFISSLSLHLDLSLLLALISLWLCLSDALVALFYGSKTRGLSWLPFHGLWQQNRGSGYPLSPIPISSSLVQTSRLDISNQRQWQRRKQNLFESITTSQTRKVVGTGILGLNQTYRPLLLLEDKIVKPRVNSSFSIAEVVFPSMKLRKISTEKHLQFFHRGKRLFHRLLRTKWRKASPLMEFYLPSMENWDAKRAVILQAI